MNFDFDEDQEELRDTVRRFLEHSSAEADVRRLMATDLGYDAAVWAQMAGQLGLHGLAIPEAYGGAGFSFVELGIVLEEMGRVLMCAPFFASAVMAAQLLLATDDEQARKDYLPAIASGETIATVALTESDGQWQESSVTMRAVQVGGTWRLFGHQDLRARWGQLRADPGRGAHRRRRGGVRGRRRRGRPVARVAAHHGPDP